MNIRTCMLAAGLVIGMIGVPSQGGIQLDSHGIGLIMQRNHALSGQSETVTGHQLEMGTSVVSLGGEPSGTAWSGLDWLQDGDGFQITAGLEHGDIDDDSISFESRMETMVRFHLSETMQVDYSYGLMFDGSTLEPLVGSIRITSDSGEVHVGSLGQSGTGGSLMLGPGFHKINTILLAQTLPEMEGSGGVGLDMTIRFTSVPAPGALALLGLAGCAGCRRRRG